MFLNIFKIGVINGWIDCVIIVLFFLSLVIIVLICSILIIWFLFLFFVIGKIWYVCLEVNFSKFFMVVVWLIVIIDICGIIIFFVGMFLSLKIFFI